LGGLDREQDVSSPIRSERTTTCFYDTLASPERRAARLVGPARLDAPWNWGAPVVELIARNLVQLFREFRST
jgi:hypothetical protein